MVEVRHRESLRKYKLKQALAQKKSPPNPLRNEAPKVTPPIRTLPASKLTANTSIDFAQLSPILQQQTAEMAKRLQVKL